jgi:hypothetical protein
MHAHNMHCPTDLIFTHGCVLAGGDEDFAKAVAGASLTPGGMVSIKSSGGGSSKHAADADGDGGGSLYKKDGKKQKQKQQGGGSSNKKHKKH